MNGGRGRAPGAGSPMLTSCSSQKMCSWMMSCCLALQVMGDHGEQPERWDDEERAGIFSDCRAGLHPARQRVCRALVSVAGRGVGSSKCHPDGVSGHPPSQGAWAWGAAALVLQGVVTAPSLPCTAPGCADLLALHLPPSPAAHPAPGATSCPHHQQAAGKKPLCLWHLHSAADHPGEPVSKGSGKGHKGNLFVLHLCTVVTDVSSLSHTALEKLSLQLLTALLQHHTQLLHTI